MKSNEKKTPVQEGEASISINSARTLSAFSATPRSEVDLDQLREQLVTVVQETMQPASLSLWIRPLKLPASAGGVRGESLSRLEEQPGADPPDSR